MRFSFAAASSDDQAALAVADDGDALRVDVLARRSGTSRRRAESSAKSASVADLGAAAALADAALVVAEHDEPGVGHGAGQLAEDRDAEREAVAIARARIRRRARPPAAASAPASAGFDSVPASENPFDGIRTCSSFGREIDDLPRAAPTRCPSRATSIFCAGTVSRSSRPFSSPQMFRSQRDVRRARW